MLTPEYLESIEFNDVVELYNKLNIQITADIIGRVSAMNEITETTKEQIKILKQTNGEEIFNEALQKSDMLTTESKNTLKAMFTNMAKEDMKGYKKLFEYRDKPFVLSALQYRILNQGLKQTNKTLKNLTNTIAFQSQQMYVEAIDTAYMQVASGAFDYATAINNTAQKLAEKGITLKDKLGRNVQLEVAVRRNILSGIHETANKINKDIEEELGCNGYEVTAHNGARPTHAEAQGKQYALDKKDAKRYGIGLWKEVEDLWQEYNCRHTYFGIILGVSEPIYNELELDEMKNATVIYNGNEIPLYEATQRQRAYENAIRKQKRTVQILEKSNQDATIARTKLIKLNKKHNDFLKETGLQKDYSRLKVSKVSTKNIKDDTIKNKIKNEVKNVQYLELTKQYNIKKKYQIKNQKYFIDENGNRYNVDGKNVILKPSQREIEVANILGKAIGGRVNIVPRINQPFGIKTPDYIINGEKFDLKQITGGGKYTIQGNLKGKEKQAHNFVIDISNAKLDLNEAIGQIDRIYNSKHYLWLNKILLIEGNEIVKAYKRI